MPCYTKLGDDPGNWKIAYDAWTCIDTVTNLEELIRVDDKTSDTIGEEFQTLLQNCRIKDVCISAKIHRLTLHVRECIKQLAMF